ncbi:uncharacterized protein [Palaemon carinicauda]|uniref:uncharacterized protein n=1 Tax=Palaemon carinicauda TaxID=392227 RepID=UPI0035B649AF
MLLLLQVCLVLGTLTHSSLAGVIYRTKYYPADPFLSATSDDFTYQDTQNSAEAATTLGPNNSAEVGVIQQQNSAEVGVTQQQNSAEVGVTQQQNSAEVGVTQQQNSAEVGITTLNPFNSGEVTSFPAIIKSPSGVNSQKTVESSHKKGGISAIKTGVKSQPESESATGQPENNPVIGTAVGTQPFFPQATGVKSQPESESATGQPENNPVIGTAVGTQPFFPQATGVKSQPEPESATGQPENSGNEETTVGTLSSSQSFNKPNSNQASSGNSIHPSKIADALNVAGLEPVTVLASNQQHAEEGNANAGESVLDSESSLPNALRDALSQVGVSETVDDPLLEEAKKYFISIWNLEAHRLGAPYLEVTDVWPEIGMVYMPTINQMSSKIQNSRPVKEAAERLKSMWEERHPTTEETPSHGFLSEFFDFFNLGRSEYPDELIPEDEPISEQLRKEIQ